MARELDERTETIETTAPGVPAGDRSTRFNTTPHPDNPEGKDLQDLRDLFATFDLFSGAHHPCGGRSRSEQEKQFQKRHQNGKNSPADFQLFNDCFSTVLQWLIEEQLKND